MNMVSQKSGFSKQRCRIALTLFVSIGKWEMMDWDAQVQLLLIKPCQNPDCTYHYALVLIAIPPQKKTYSASNACTSKCPKVSFFSIIYIKHRFFGKNNIYNVSPPPGFFCTYKCCWKTFLWQKFWQNLRDHAIHFV